ncbi:MAG: glutamine synthetase III [Chlamydiales bacterium]
MKEDENRSRRDYTSRHAVFDVFGENVFNDAVQRQSLPDHVFYALQKTVKMGEELSETIADAVALGMKKWALEKGATHFCHWFQPLTDLTAEKHDSFFVPNEEGMAISEFNGKMLIQGEPDASSFPTGGLRTTFEARGYTAWDPSSSVFILGRTLVIPSLFLSWTGDALDKKTPLLRSMEALDKQAKRILRLFGDQETKRVVPTLGAEQEYFLIDTEFFNLRPDLISCGRTLFGASPPKGQELEDQYLGAIPERVVRIMEETEYELMRLGVPIKTRHNEVAPSQYEIALSYQTANLAADHHMLLMELLKKVANRHHMTCLMHEKPFKGINGSGKHVNWSLGTDRGENLLEPGETPHANARFLLFCAAVARAVHRYAPLLRMGIASAGNDHRLGVHEAPPAIMSVFLGEQLHDIFQNLIQKGTNHGSKRLGQLEIGISILPKIPRHSSDRNRTSPFAFTGNKFEFRAVGSSENISKAGTILNTIMTESLDYFATELESKTGDFNHDLQQLLARSAKEFQSILFEGDNYNAVWEKEALSRKLPHITNTVDAAMLYTSPGTVELFEKYKVYSCNELTSRQEILLEKYIKKINIEAKAASNIAHTMIIPASIRYIKELGEAKDYLSSSNQDLLQGIVSEFSRLRKALELLDEQIEKQPKEDVQMQARYVRDMMLPQLGEVRKHADWLEERVADSLWPLPKYREMLFIR